ncbi:MAG: chorismate-binding protein, partial [Planctomycetia bacterium]|nr:chorismate-binding protein [Planctomycetia bacterium]
MVGAAAPPLVEELHPAPDPWQVARRLAARRHLLFLDSRGLTDGQASYSYLLAEPYSWLQARRGQVWLDGRLLPTTDPFAALQAQLARWQDEALPGLPPFQGGAAGLFGYDLCHHIERLPRPRFDDFEVPDLALGFYDVVLAFDHQAGRAWLISTGFPETDAHKRRQRAEQRLRQCQHWLRAEAMPPVLHVNGTIEPALRVPVPQVLPGLCSNFDRASYLDTARRAIEYVHAGDCFQVNIAQRLLLPAQWPALELYGRLRERNPAPFAGYFDLGE